MKKILFQFLLFILFITSGFGQINNISIAIDSLLLKNEDKSFNGVVLIKSNKKKIYEKVIGFSNFENKTLLANNDCFVVGSISKQFTAVLTLMEFEKKHLELHVPIRNYLPELKQSWADTVTIHHLLTHMHGIEAIDKPLLLAAGSQFMYSQIGYDLLAQIIEKTSGEKFSDLSKKMFEKCGMKNTFHPDYKSTAKLCKGYTKVENDTFEFEENTFQNYPAAGSFISNTEDLILWNDYLFEGKLLKKSTMNLLLIKHKGAVRNHPIFGKTEYGYGVTINTSEDKLQYGQTGFAPGFVSMNFYFPKKKLNVVVLENIVDNPNDLKKTFYYHTEILKIIRETL